MSAVDAPTFPAVTLWHNPGCSKSRRALEILEKTGCELSVREYLSAPPSVEELVQVVGWLKRPVADIVRRKEPLYAELGLEAADDAGVLRALAANPSLIERPIAIAPSREAAALGRPMAEMVLQLLDPSLPAGMDGAELLRRLAQGKLV